MSQRQKLEGRDLGRALSLNEAAAQAFALAKEEGLPLARLAGQAGPEAAQGWFASSILHIVPVSGASGDEARPQRIAPAVLEGLLLGHDLSSLSAEGESTPAYRDLRVSREDFKRYMRWARTVY